uniref:Uncharacterized protein n=1 Tax=uncultured marine microorganism HF4000_009L19 TaxID=455516 RepID=B3T1H7_9ZZZZ|nr:hypothetical protein ALOHA_HF4000009L19ctg2g11 [uncultured marine microorganism HF4000_009L19]
MTKLADSQELAVHREQRSAARSQYRLPLTAGLLESLGPPRRLTPDHAAVGSVDTGQRRVTLVPPVEAVEIPVLVDRRVEVQRERLRGPDHLGREVGAHMHQRAAGPIAGRDEHRVVEDDRAGGVDRFVGAAAEREREVDLAVGRVDRQQASGRRRRFAAGRTPAPAVRRAGLPAPVRRSSGPHSPARHTSRPVAPSNATTQGPRGPPRRRSAARSQPAGSTRAEEILPHVVLDPGGSSGSQTPSPVVSSKAVQPALRRPACRRDRRR